MPRYSLRTLLILLAIGPPLVARAWWGYQREMERRRNAEFDRLIELVETTEFWGDMGGWGSVDNLIGTPDVIVGSDQAVDEKPTGNQ